MITEFTRTDLADERHLRSNLAQARNLLAESGLDELTYVQHYVYPALSATKATRGIERRGAFFFACLRDLLAAIKPRQHPGHPETENPDRSAA